MGRFFLALGMAAFAAPMCAPAWAQWTNEPYSYRGGGFSAAYRQAMLDRELFGREPRNLVRSPDGRLVDVIRRDGQAFVVEREPNLLVDGGGAGAWPAPPLAGVRVRAGIAGTAVAIDGWTAMVGSVRPVE